MRVLVTGGSGFIGSAVVRHLLQSSDASVVNVDKLTYAATPEALAAVESDRRYAFEHADIGDRAAMTRIIRHHRPNAIMNLAAETHVDRSIDAPSAFIQTNIVGTASLLDAALDYWQSLNGPARQAFRFHHVSTDEVFGSLGADGAFSESTPYQPNSPYSASKAAADHLVRAWHHTYGLPTLVSNCSNNYGPWQFPEKLIPLMIINAFHGRPLPVYGKGENVRDWLHVEDHAAALLRILTRGRPGESYNVGGNAERRNLAIVEAICDLVDKLAGALPSGRRRTLITFVADRPGHDLRYAIDPTKIRAELGWEPSVDFEQGLERTVAWYLANRNWWEGVRQRVYGQERLGRRGVGD